METLFTRDLPATFLGALPNKAPKGMKYVITDVLMTVVGAGASNIYILRRHVDPDTNIAEIGLDDMIFTNFCSVAGFWHVPYRGPIVTKFFTVIKDEAAARVKIIVIGDLVKATKADLIWEWFRFGR